MIIYGSLLIWVAIMCSMSDRAKRSFNKQSENIYFIFAVAAMIYVYTIRWYVGTDFGTYKDIFYLTGQKKFSDFFELEKEALFNMIDWIIYQINHTEYRFHNFVYGLIIYTAAAVTIKRNTKNCMSAMVFYILTLSYTFSFNGMRQGLALTICFAAHKLLIEKKYKWYALWIFVAMEIHITTIMVVPFFILGKLPINNKKLVIFELVFLISMISIGGLWDNIMNLLNNMGQDKLVGDYGDVISTSYGVKPIRLIVQLPPIIVAIWRYNNLKRTDYNGMLDYYINMSIFSAIFMVASLRVVTLARFSSYFAIYQALLIPRFFKGFQRESEQKLFNVILLICYIAMWVVLLNVDSNLLPFRLNNGTKFY